MICSERILKRREHAVGKKVVENVEVKDFVSQLDLGSMSVSVSVGAGELNETVWSKKGMAIESLVDVPTNMMWERLLFETGSTVYIYEPMKEKNTKWQKLLEKIGRLGLSAGELIIPRGKEASFQNSRIEKNSVDIVVAMNLFGSPLLALDEKTSVKVVEKIGYVLKNDGILIVGDTYEIDRKLTGKRLEVLGGNGITLKKIFESKREKVTPWVAYEIVK